MRKEIFFLCFLFFFPLSENLLSAQESTEYWFEVPNRTLSLISSNGYGLKKGEGYYQNAYLLYNSFGYGITDNLSVNIGLVPLGILFDDDNSIFTLSPKLNIPIEETDFHIGLGSTLLMVLNFGGTEIAGAVYGIGTYGTTDDHISGGLGFRFDDSGLVQDPLIIISGQYRGGKKMSLVSEMWFLPFSDTNFPMISIGLRFMGKNFSMDLAYLNLSDFESNNSWRTQLPLVSFIVPFGRR